MNIHWSIVGVFFVYLVIAGFMVWQILVMKQQIKKSARQNAWSELFGTFDKIDEYIVSHYSQMQRDGVKTPYNPESQPRGFALLLKHTDLIYRYWIYQGSLEDDERSGFERWIDVVFFAWLKDNEGKLFKDYQEVVRRKDLYSDKFIDWLEDKRKRSIHFT